MQELHDMRRRFTTLRITPHIVAGLICAVIAMGPIDSARAAQAAPKKHENIFEITPFAGFAGGGEFESVDGEDVEDRDLDSDTAFGVFVDIMADVPERQYELLYAQLGGEIEGEVTPIDIDVDYLHIGGIVNFTDTRWVVPYFGMTAGATRLDPDSPDLSGDTKLSFSIGGGLKVPFTNHFGMRFDMRAFVTLLGSDANIFCGSNGEGGTCAIRAKSDTFTQFSTSLGFSFAF
jgi:hypothetical protein